MTHLERPSGLEGRAGLEVRGAGTGNCLLVASAPPPEDEEEEVVEFSSCEELPEELCPERRAGVALPGGLTSGDSRLLRIGFFHPMQVD